MQRILVFDIEIAPMLAYVWGRKDVNVSLNQIKQDWFVLAWSAKWLGEPAKNTIYMDQRRASDVTDDKFMLGFIWQLLDKADVVITQNGKNFDAKKLNARFIMHGMTPPSPYVHLDTLQIVRRVAGFTSSSLEYLTDKLCKKYKKLSHSKFPGMELWKECLKGNKKAWEEMKRYNIHDTLATEELYMKIRAWVPESLKKIHAPTSKCRVCVSDTKMWHKGYEYRKTGKFHRYQCQKCFSWTIGGKA